MTRFQICLHDVLKHEGGFVDHPRDPGGATNMGITIGTLSDHLGRPATKEEVRRISMVTVSAIYKSRYWLTTSAHRVRPGFDRVLFDAGVNSGPRRGIQWFQKGLGVTSDGKFGPNTLAHAKSPRPSPVEVVEGACRARMGFLKGLSHWNTFGRGWSRRVAGVEALALKDVGLSLEGFQKRSKAANNAGKAQTGASGAAAPGAAGVSIADLPIGAIAAIIAILAGFALLMYFRGRHQNDRAQAMAAIVEEIELEMAQEADTDA